MVGLDNLLNTRCCSPCGLGLLGQSETALIRPNQLMEPYPYWDPKNRHVQCLSDVLDSKGFNVMILFDRCKLYIIQPGLRYLFVVEDPDRFGWLVTLVFFFNYESFFALVFILVLMS